MSWLDELATHWQSVLAPEGTPIMQRLEAGLQRNPIPRREGYETIRLPENNFLVGRGGQWVSSLTPSSPPRVINLTKGNRMWEHDGYIISTAGIDPIEGELDHCSGGGCQNRAFANASYLRQSAAEVERDYLHIAAEHGDIDEDEIDFAMNKYTHVPYNQIADLASRHYLIHDDRLLGLGLDEVLVGMGNGVVYADTGDEMLGAHLVAVHQGKQIVPHPEQLLHAQNDYSGGLEHRPSLLTLPRYLSDAQMGELKDAAATAGYTTDWRKYIEDSLDKGENPFVLPLDIGAVFVSER